MHWDIAAQQTFFTNSLHTERTIADEQSQAPAQSYNLRQAAAVAQAHLVAVAAEYSFELASHGNRVGYFAALIAQELGLPAAEIDLIRRAGLLHDIGKVLVPWEIYTKPEALSAVELEQIRRHPVDGERLCAAYSGLAPLLPIIRHHHERLDGTGYPDGLKGEAIPVGAQVVAVADYYDALTSDRWYRRALAHNKAAVVMSQACFSGHLNLNLVEALLWGLEQKATSLLDLAEAELPERDALELDLALPHVDFDGR